MSVEVSRFRAVLSLLSARYWNSLPGRPEIIALAALLLYFSYCMAAHGWVPLLDWATLTIHEAGHPIIAVLLGQNMMVYGGSLFQVAFPLLFVWYFVRRNQAAGFCFALAWEASALHALGRYVADARAQALPLVGNGDRIHDWNEILGRWNLLGYDHFLGSLLYLACWILMLGCFCMLWNWWPGGATGDRTE